MTEKEVSEKPIRPFATAQVWRAWLEKNQAKPEGMWLRIYKKDSAKKTVTHLEALDEALCYGWIDGQRKAYDTESFLQKFTPRRSKSLWSKRNRENVMRLIKERRMTAAGLAEIDAAKKDGRWEQAYDAGSTMQVPADFLAALKKDKKAYEFFKTLNKANTYAIAWRLQTARKPETRMKRMEALLALMKEGRKLH
ncbi:MAG: YdeI/OmpD-associated family protein [Candidatus Paceibacterota bacterium]